MAQPTIARADGVTDVDKSAWQELTITFTPTLSFVSSLAAENAAIDIIFTDYTANTYFQANSCYIEIGATILGTDVDCTVVDDGGPTNYGIRVVGFEENLTPDAVLLRVLVKALNDPAAKDFTVSVYEKVSGAFLLREDSTDTPGSLAVETTAGKKGYDMFTFPPQWQFPSDLRVSTVGPLTFQLVVPGTITKKIGYIQLNTNDSTNWNQFQPATGGSLLCLWNKYHAYSCTSSAASDLIDIYAPEFIDITAGTYTITITSINADDPDNNGIQMPTAATADKEYRFTVSIEEDGTNPFEYDGSTDFHLMGAKATQDFASVLVDYTGTTSGSMNLITVKVTATTQIDGASTDRLVVYFPTKNLNGDTVFANDLGKSSIPSGYEIPCDTDGSTSATSATCYLHWGENEVGKPAFIDITPNVNISAADEFHITFDLIQNPTNAGTGANDIIVDLTVMSFSGWDTQTLDKSATQKDATTVFNAFYITDTITDNYTNQAATVNWKTAAPTTNLGTTNAILELAFAQTATGAGEPNATLAKKSKVYITFPEAIPVSGTPAAITANDGTIVVYEPMNAILLYDITDVSATIEVSLGTTGIAYNAINGANPKQIVIYMYTPNDYAVFQNSGTTLSEDFVHQDVSGGIEQTNTATTIAPVNTANVSELSYGWFLFTSTMQADTAVPASGCVRFKLIMAEWDIPVAYCLLEETPTNSIANLQPNYTKTTLVDEFNCAITNDSTDYTITLTGFAADYGAATSPISVKLWAAAKDDASVTSGTALELFNDNTCTEIIEQDTTGSTPIAGYDANSLGNPGFYFDVQKRQPLIGKVDEYVELKFFLQLSNTYTAASNTYFDLTLGTQFQAKATNAKIRCEMEHEQITNTFPLAKVAAICTEPQADVIRVFPKETIT